MTAAEIMRIEQLQVQVACAWQGASTSDLGFARLLRWPRPALGVLVAVTAAPAQRAALLESARGAQVVLTPAAPQGTESFLRAHGFRLCRVSLVLSCRREWFRDRSRPEIAVAAVGAEELEAWHQVFTGSFGTATGDTLANLDTTRQAYRALAPEAEWLLARWQGMPVGCGILCREADMGFLLAVGTLPQARRRGVAATLVSAAVRTALATGAQQVFLETGPQNVARRLYRGIGFRLAYRRRILMAT